MTGQQFDLHTRLHLAPPSPKLPQFSVVHVVVHPVGIGV
jgi:hypothetical protein